MPFELARARARSVISSTTFRCPTGPRTPSTAPGHPMASPSRRFVSPTSTAARQSKAPPLYRAKLSRPNLGSLVLERPHLVHALAEHASRPLSLVVADAGYGKTTLLTSFAR